MIPVDRADDPRLAEYRLLNDQRARRSHEGDEFFVAEGYVAEDERVVINCSGHTFSAEKHALEDRHVLHLRSDEPAGDLASQTQVHRALSALDEQATSIVVRDGTTGSSSRGALNGRWRDPSASTTTWSMPGTWANQRSQVGPS